MEQQSGKERDIAAGPQCQMQIGNVAGRGAPGVDDNDARAARLPCRGEALVQHRMAPRGIAADQDDEVGRVDVLVAAGDDVLAKGADMPRH
jgi:hypothetical protein